MKIHQLYVSPSVWLTLESLFKEERQYRGDNSIRLVDLEKLLEAIKDKGELKDQGVSIQKDGGAFSCSYTFDPKIWGKWFSKQDLALSMAAMDKDVTAQYAGRSQGHTVHKKNWGGQVVNSPGKPRNDFERMPSSMDRYDVLMQGDVTTKSKRNKKTGEVEEVPVGNLLRIAYSPSVGSVEERKARLLAFMAGNAAPELRRRPQPHIPEPTRKAADDAKAIKSPSVPRVGQNLKTVSNDDGPPDSRSIGGGAAPSHFTSFLSKHNAEYQPQVKRNRDDDAEDALTALFPKGKK